MKTLKWHLVREIHAGYFNMCNVFFDNFLFQFRVRLSPPRHQIMPVTFPPLPPPPPPPAPPLNRSPRRQPRHHSSAPRPPPHRWTLCSDRWVRTPPCPALSTPWTGIQTRCSPPPGRGTRCSSPTPAWILTGTCRWHIWMRGWRRSSGLRRITAWWWRSWRWRTRLTLPALSSSFRRISAWFMMSSTPM